MEESTDYNYNVIVPIIVVVLLFIILVFAICYLAKYEKLKDMICCLVSWKGEKKRNVEEIVIQFLRKDQGCATNDTGQGEMLPSEKQG